MTSKWEFTTSTTSTVSTSQAQTKILTSSLDYLLISHFCCVLLSETTQIENPRTQWRQEQERMLKEYLVVAQEALKAKKEMYLIKQQRLELAQQEMLLFHELSEDNRSITSSKTHYQPLVNFPDREYVSHLIIWLELDILLMSLQSSSPQNHQHIFLCSQRFPARPQTRNTTLTKSKWK